MRRAILTLLIATILAEVAFLGWPGIDLAASAPFYDPASRSWIAEAPLANAVREGLWTVLKAFLVASVIMLALSFLGRRPRAVPRRLWVFGILAIAIVPGLLVNALLKSHWGRARPRNIEAFGGTADFTPAWQIADQCARNCSFVSGEVAGAATVALVLWLFLGANLRGARRGMLAAGLIAAVALSALLRIAAGGHFLSDSIFACLIAALVTLTLWHLMRCAPLAPRVTLSAILADLRAPFLRNGHRPDFPPK